MFSKSLFEGGYLIVDHSNSPGLPEEVARLVGYNPDLCKEGKVYESVTMRCNHCLGHIVKNPLRHRDRGYCAKCDDPRNGKDGYVCDYCAADMRRPEYVHLSGDERHDLIASGKWVA